MSFVSLAPQRRVQPIVILALSALLDAAGARLSLGAVPEAPDGRFRRLTVADGLAESRLRAILQDRRGFLWICTIAGLDRYDGLAFRHFRHDPADPQSLGAGFPQKLLEDRHGRLWVALQRGGLSRFDPVTERFTQLHHDPTRADSLSNDEVNDVFEGRDGALWIATAGGLDRLDPETERVTRFGHDAADPNSLADNDVTSVLEDRGGALWVGLGKAGLDRLTLTGGIPRFQHFRHDAKRPQSLSGDAVHSLLEDRGGRLWVGTWTGLDRYDAEQGSFVRYGSDSIFDLLEDHDGALWVATWGNGLARLDPGTGALRRYRPDALDPESLRHTNVTSLFEDRTGLLWIGTGGGGLNVLDLNGKAFRRHRLAGPVAAEWNARDVRAVLQDRRGDLWLGTAGGGLLRLDRAGRVLRDYRHMPYDAGSLADDNVWSLLEDREGALWVGTFAGLDRFDDASGRFVHHRHDPGDMGTLSENTVYALHEDAQGQLWVGTWNGLDRLDKRTGRFTRFGIGDAQPGSPKTDAVLAIGEDAAGAIWFADRGALGRLEPSTGARELVALGSAPGRGEGAPPVTAFTLDTAGTLWVGTGTGLGKAPRAGDKDARVRLYTPTGLAGVVISSLEQGTDGALWLGTTAGLARYDPATGAVRIYTTSDGLPAENFGIGSAFRSASGELFFGTSEGLVSFRPEQIVEDNLPPPVVITSVLLGQRSGGSGGHTLPLSPAPTQEIQLSYDERLVTFEFAALSFRAPRKNRFRYQLEGFDAAPTGLPGDRRGVTYTNLPPGRYVFRVTAANDDSVWNPTGASLAIRVMPPWWGTWWFRLLGLLGGASMLLAAHRLRVRSIQTRNERLELEVGERRRAEEAMAQSERQVRLIADSLPVLIAYVDQDDRCLFMNAVAERWFRRPRAELIGKKLDEIVPPELRTTLRDLVTRAVARQGRRSHVEVTVLDGRRRASVAVVAQHGGGTLRGFLVLAQDITPRVRAEQALRRQQDQLAHTSRILTLGELAAALAHELNQPLTAILSNAQATHRLHAAAGQPADDMDDALEDIANDASRAGEIIRRLREMVHRGESKKEPLDVNAAIRGVEPLLRAGALEHNVALDLELAPGLPETLGDVIQIQQVILNLARNATEAMLSMPKESRRLCIRTSRDSGSLAVEVEDTGPPVDDETFARLFVPFETTKPGGLGMGLSVSRSIVEAHGGRIAADRDPVGGLRVRFSLPLTRR